MLIARKMTRRDAQRATQRSLLDPIDRSIISCPEARPGLSLISHTFSHVRAAVSVLKLDRTDSSPSSNTFKCITRRGS